MSKRKKLLNSYKDPILWYDETQEYIEFCDYLSVKLYNIGRDAGLKKSQIADKMHTNRQAISAMAKQGGLNAKEKSGERAIRITPAYFIWKYSEITGIPVEEILDFKFEKEDDSDGAKLKRIIKKRRMMSEEQSELIKISESLDKTQMQLLIKIAKDINETRLK